MIKSPVALMKICFSLKKYTFIVINCKCLNALIHEYVNDEIQSISDLRFQAYTVTAYTELRAHHLWQLGLLRAVISL